jgi:hypothetical protein
VGLAGWYQCKMMGVSLSLSLSLAPKLMDHTKVEMLFFWFKTVETGVGDGEAAAGVERNRFKRLQEAAAGRAAANNAG